MKRPQVRQQTALSLLRSSSSSSSSLRNVTSRTSVCLSSSTSLRRDFSASAFVASPQNLVEKIVQKYTVNNGDRKVQSLDFVTIKPQHVMTHDNTSAVIKKFDAIVPTKVKDKRQIVFTLDHNIQDQTEANLKKYDSIKNFAKKHHIDFYPAGRGIGHQIMCEEGYAFPGTMLVASDSHSNMYGGLGCLGTPLVRTDAASIWATSTTWWQIPPVTKVVLEGKLESWATGKDIIITLCGLFNKDDVLNHAIEFSGEGVGQLSIDERLAIANMTTEWGALAGVFPVDDKTINWLKDRVRYLRSTTKRQPVQSDEDTPGKHPRLNEERIKKLEATMHEWVPDKDAYYTREIRLDLSTVRPHVSGPNHVKVMQSVGEMEKKKMKIHKAYIVSCVNSRVGDLAKAASVMKGKKVAEGVEFYVAAASSEVEEQSRERGDWKVLLEAGAKPLPPGCGPCIGLGAGLLQKGEVGISATNRNFKGRMGSREADVYLASPEVVAASAVAGYICSPPAAHNGDLLVAPVGSVKTFPVSAAAGKKAEAQLLPGFVQELAGDIVFCPQDNINTDGIYPGKYTYNENISPQEQAEVAMENYDPNFKSLTKKGDILVSAFNFGTGSSREQAATCLKYYGIPLVIAGSFSETYKRNAFNNGYLLIEIPELVEYLREKVKTTAATTVAPTVRTGLKAKIDFKRSVLTVDGKEFPFPVVGTIAQDLILTGGLEEWIKKQITVAV